MPRYDETYEILAERAVSSTTVDIEAFIRQAQASGMSIDAVAESLMADLESGGPIFGKFLRNVVSAGEASVMAAARQGENAGAVLHDPRVRAQIDLEDEALNELLEVESLDDVVAGADPEQLARLEGVTENIDETWVATLVNTCDRCLPLHGITRSRRQWALLGLNPETIHEGWASRCKCRLVPAVQTDGREDLMEPLLRERVAKGDKRTVRSIAQPNLQRSIEAVNQARESEEGRRLLRRLGQANKE